MTTREDGIEPQWRRRDLERALICEGSEVVSDDLECLGHIRRLTFDASDQLLSVTTELVVTDAEVEVPAALIVTADDGSLYLRCTKYDLCDKTAPSPTRHAAGTVLAMPA